MKISALILLSILAVTLGSRHLFPLRKESTTKLAKVANKNPVQEHDPAQVQEFAEYLAKIGAYFTKKYYAEYLESEDLFRALGVHIFNEIYLCDDENEDMCPSDELFGWIMKGGDDFSIHAGKEANRILSKDIEFLGRVFNYYSPIGHLSEERIDDSLAKGG